MNQKLHSKFAKHHRVALAVLALTSTLAAAQTRMPTQWGEAPATATEPVVLMAQADTANAAEPSTPGVFRRMFDAFKRKDPADPVRAADVEYSGSGTGTPANGAPLPPQRPVSGAPLMPRGNTEQLTLFLKSAWLDSFWPERDANKRLAAARATSASAVDGESRGVGARSARISELPGLVNVPATLPIKLEGLPNYGPGLSLDQAIALGVAASLDVQANAARAEGFAHGARASLGALLPKVDLQANRGKGRLDTVSPAEVLPRTGYTLVAKQSVFDLGLRSEYQRQLVLNESAHLQLQGAQSTAALSVANAYLQALQARLTLEISRDYEQMMGELLGQITDRAAAGGTSKAEADRVRARVANARSQMADARANLRSAVRGLESLIGTLPSELTVSSPEGMVIPLTSDNARLEAIAGNRDLVSARTEAQAIGLEVKSQYAKHLPKVDISLERSRSVNAAGSASVTQDNKANVSMSWSLYNGGTDMAQSKAARARMLEKELRNEDELRKLSTDLESTYAALDAVDERYKALNEELGANRTVVEAFKAQMGSGNRQMLDVLDAYQRLFQSKSDLTQLVIGELQNHVKVAHLTGRLAQRVAQGVQAR